MKLPGATALEIITTATERTAQRSTPWLIENYCIFYNGIGYEVQYSMPRSIEAIDSPILDMSARTIHFSS